MYVASGNDGLIDYRFKCAADPLKPKPDLLGSFIIVQCWGCQPYFCVIIRAPLHQVDQFLEGITKAKFDASFDHSDGWIPKQIQAAAHACIL